MFVTKDEYQYECMCGKLYKYYKYAYNHIEKNLYNKEFNHFLIKIDN